MVNRNCHCKIEFNKINRLKARFFTISLKLTLSKIYLLIISKTLITNLVTSKEKIQIERTLAIQLNLYYFRNWILSD